MKRERTGAGALPSSSLLSSFSSSSVSRALGRFVFAALLATILLAALPYGAVEPWWTALVECLIFGLAILWIVEGLLSGTWLVRSHALLMPMLLLTAYCFTQTVPVAAREVAGVQVWQTLSADPYQTRLVALKLLAYTLAAAMLLRYTESAARLRALVYTVIGVALLSALFGLIRQTTQQEPVGFVLPYLRKGSGYGQFINKNHFVFLAEMALGLLLGLLASGGRREQLLIYLALALPVWTALVLSNSRGGLFSMLAQVLFLGLLLLSLRRGSKEREAERGATASVRFKGSAIVRAMLFLSLGAILLVGAVWVGGEPLVERLETMPGEVSGAGPEQRAGVSRKAIWRATWELIKAHPAAGVGFGGYGAAIPQYHQASGRMTPREAHNDYLELLASGGVVGPIVLVWFLFAFIRRVRERLRLCGGFARAATVGALVGLFGVAVHSLFDFGLHIPVNALVLLALVCIAACDVVEMGPSRETAS